MTHRTRRRGFSLIEILTVLVLILILISQLVPLLSQGISAGYTAECANNLRQIYMAHQQAARDFPRSSTVVMNPAGWTSRLSPYVSDDQNVFRCPEDPYFSTGFGFDFHMGFHSKRTSRNPNINKITHIISFKDGSQKVRQISVEQYEEMGQLYSTKNVSGGRIRGTKAIAAWWRQNMSVRPGSRDPSTTWIVLEPDAGWKTNTHQFHDYLVKVERLDGGTRLTPMRGSANSNEEYAWFVDEDGNDLLSPTGRLRFNESSRHIMVDGDSITNYGANEESLYRVGGYQKILMIDYRNPLAEVDTWHNWDGLDGNPAFARHPGNTLNVLRLNGSVRRFNAEQINPEYVANELKYWAF